MSYNASGTGGLLKRPIRLITADLSNWGRPLPMGVIAHTDRDDENGPLSEYCEDPDDFKAFLHENAARIDADTELQFIVTADEVLACMNAMMMIRGCFDLLKRRNGS